ncbi:hypothetical protein ADU59_14920 [Pararhizobium polonicum]|uniref:Uncharacterized protein n=1 Tax=Pararhizobium polonicum TaxID=1612624 RepID=A0A1C7NZP0_9HYPH|nr:hypothetical protein [Pararhizobium polonicum]OBZ94493.1 hypothetical protein ADU59_14920 [Pararhizobium polonicum]
MSRLRIRTRELDSDRVLARTPQIDQDQSEYQRQDYDHLEIDDLFQRDTPSALDVGDAAQHPCEYREPQLAKETKTRAGFWISPGYVIVFLTPKSLMFPSLAKNAMFS